MQLNLKSCHALVRLWRLTGEGMGPKAGCRAQGLQGRLGKWLNWGIISIILWFGKVSCNILVVCGEIRCLGGGRSAKKFEIGDANGCKILRLRTTADQTVQDALEACASADQALQQAEVTADEARRLFDQAPKALWSWVDMVIEDRKKNMQVCKSKTMQDQKKQLSRFLYDFIGIGEGMKSQCYRTWTTQEGYTDLPGRPGPTYCCWAVRSHLGHSRARCASILAVSRFTTSNIYIESYWIYKSHH